MSNPQDSYASYLLRLRRVPSDTGRSWLASLQSTATGAEQRFVDLNALVGFLQSEFGSCKETADTEHSIERSEAIP
jgi:hypothetical protein